MQLEAAGCSHRNRQSWTQPRSQSCALPARLSQCLIVCFGYDRSNQIVPAPPQFVFETSTHFANNFISELFLR